MRKMTFVFGFGVGYLLGTKAGRARYEQIMRSLREVKDNPTVQETAGVVQAQAVDLLSTAKEKVSGTLSNTGFGQKISSAVGRGDDTPGTPTPPATADYSAGSNGFVR